MSDADYEVVDPRPEAIIEPHRAFEYRTVAVAHLLDSNGSSARAKTLGVEFSDQAALPYGAPPP